MRVQEVFAVTGMTCVACSAHVEKTVGKLPGVSSVGVNLVLGSMTVTYDAAAVTQGQIIAAVVDAGYGAQTAVESDRQKSRDTQQQYLTSLRNRLKWSLVCLIPLFYLGMGHMIGLPLPAILTAKPLWYGLLQLCCCLPILILNRAYFTVGFSRLFRGSPNMDSLVALGAAAGLVYSLCQLPTAAGGTVPAFYFESAGMILTLVTVGKYLEQRSHGKTTDAISSLLSLSPDSAVVKRNGQESTIPVAQIVVGDTVILRSGSKIGVDGVVSGGTATVDEASLTGESLPVEKMPGGTVTSGTVVKSGYLEITAQRIGQDTTLSQIVRLMEEAAGSKAPISRLADRISGVFVPAVIVIAVISGLLWRFIGHQPLPFCLSSAIAVLVISCPCALGLATPVAIMVGTGKAAEYGILIKSASSLELLGKVDTVVFDKTGTVTEGMPRLVQYLCAPGISESELLTQAASAEQPSEHPLALAIVREAAQRGLSLLPVSDFQSVSGGGVIVFAEGNTILGGNERLMQDHRIDVTALRPAAQSMAEQGWTPLFFARNDALLGLLALADTPKPDSADAVRALQQSGHRVLLLTGDNSRTADAIARRIGVDDVLAQVLPGDKAAKIAACQAAGQCVAMVGDGINDAPALMQADVGLAIGAGTDIAIESADVVLMHSSLQDIVSAMDLSRAVLRNIRQNLFWAFFYNAIGIPIAAGALYPAFGLTLNPMLGAAAMSMSSFCVVSNALRLRLWKPQTADASNTQNEEEITMTKTITIEGMMCMHCSGRVEKALNALPGVTAAVDLEKKTAAVTGDATDEALRKAVTDAGYEVISIQ